MNWKCLAKSFGGALVVIFLVAAFFLGWIWIVSHFPAFISLSIVVIIILAILWTVFYKLCVDEEKRDAESE
jgi:hypothetical protein